MMTKYRCYVCPPPADRPNENGREFEVADKAKPECPSCGSTEASGAIQRIMVIHYEPPMREELRGRKGSGRAACDSGKKPGTNGILASGNTAAVTCEECLKSDVWHADAHHTGHKAGGTAVGFQDVYFYRAPDHKRRRLIEDVMKHGNASEAAATAAVAKFESKHPLLDVFASWDWATILKMVLALLPLFMVEAPDAGNSEGAEPCTGDVGAK